MPEQVPADTALVQITDDLGLVFGAPDSRDHFELEPLLVLADQDKDRMREACATALGFAGTAASGANALTVLRGVVRLAPETLAQLRTATPLVNATGWNLGALARDGVIAHQVQWAPLGAQGATAVLSSLGPSVTMIAIQMQLRDISKKIDRNIELTAGALDEIRDLTPAGVEGTGRAVARALKEARLVGRVPDHIFAEVRGQQPALEAARRVLRRRLGGYSRELTGLKTGEDRSKWLRMHSASVLTDGRAASLLVQSDFAYRMLRVAHLNNEGADPALIEHVAQTAIEDRDPGSLEVDRLLDLLVRQFGILDETAGKGMKLGRGRTIRETQASALVLREEMSFGMSVDTREDAAEEIELGPPDMVLRAKKIVHWILAADEELIGVAICNLEPYVKSRSVVFLTNQRVLVARWHLFIRTAELNRATANGDFRWVHAEQARHEKLIHVTCQADRFTLSFSADVEPVLQAKFVEHLRSLMRLPEEERVLSPLSFTRVALPDPAGIAMDDLVGVSRTGSDDLPKE